LKKQENVKHNEEEMQQILYCRQKTSVAAHLTCNWHETYLTSVTYNKDLVIAVVILQKHYCRWFFATCVPQLFLKLRF